MICSLPYDHQKMHSLILFWYMNEGEAHSDSGCHFSTPKTKSLDFLLRYFCGLELEKAYCDMDLHPPLA